MDNNPLAAVYVTNIFSSLTLVFYLNYDVFYYIKVNFYIAKSNLSLF